eukprot:826699-Pleurochrysis_carterae.AAC.1
MSCPTPQLFAAAKRILMYMHHHKTIGLRYEHCRRSNLVGFSDSDWTTRHSTSGYVFAYNMAAVS